MTKNVAILMALALSAPGIAAAGPYLGVGIGGARFESTLNDIGLFPQRQIPDTSTPDPSDTIFEYQGSDDYTSTDVAFDAMAGWMFGRYVGVEVGYSDYGTASQLYELPESCTVQGCQSREWTATIDATAWRAFVIGNLPLGESFDVYAKVGAVMWDADFNGFERNRIFVPGPPIGPRNDPIRFSDDGTDVAAGLGLTLRTDSAFSLKADFTFYDIDNTDLTAVAQVIAVYTF